MYQQTSQILQQQQKRHVTSTASINCHSKKVLLYFAYILISNHITFDNYNLLLLYKTTVQYKMENNEFKKVQIKNRTCYYFNDIIKLEDFDLDNFLKITQKYFDL